MSRPLLRLSNPTNSTSRKGKKANFPTRKGPGYDAQRQKFQSTFDSLEKTLERNAAGLTSHTDGLSPERALVFVVAGPIGDFAKKAEKILLLEVLQETILTDMVSFPEGFDVDVDRYSGTLYTTMPTYNSLRELLRLWSAYKVGEKAPKGAAPIWNLFDLLIEIRPWNYLDRLSEESRRVFEDRLAMLEDDESFIEVELEIWPTILANEREKWLAEIVQLIDDTGGQVIDRVSIEEQGFIYQAVLAKIPREEIRTMLDSTGELDGLIGAEGIQHILPQSFAIAIPSDSEGDEIHFQPQSEFNADSKIRVALLDGTPVARHPALDKGVDIYDMHDIVRLSTVDKRAHATSMASIISRGDLVFDGEALVDSRLLSVPILVDSERGAYAPRDKIFVKLVHETLSRLFHGAEPYAADVFVVNFSIGIKGSNFSGRLSSLGRLLDWWASNEGILFVISAGNLGSLELDGLTFTQFDDASQDERQRLYRRALARLEHRRTLLAPAEALNGLSVGAISNNFGPYDPPVSTSDLTIEREGQLVPQMTSALGLGYQRIMKPDLVATGGQQNVQVVPSDRGIKLRSTYPLRTGLNVASVNGSVGKDIGTSAAAAIVTRAIVQTAHALVTSGGPYEGQELPRRQLALLTKALAINSARWGPDAVSLLEQSMEGGNNHFHAKENVSKYYGFGHLDIARMTNSPEGGATLVGYGAIKTNESKIFKLPIPQVLSGEKLARSMHVTLAWFSPTKISRTKYRQARIFATAEDEHDIEDSEWLLGLKTNSKSPDHYLSGRGSIWSKRLIHKRKQISVFGEEEKFSICVQCKDASGGGLNPDDDIEFAIAVTLELEEDVQFDIYQEILNQTRVRV